MDDITLADTVEPTGEPSKLDTEALYITLRDWFRADMDHSAQWRMEAKEDFDFVAGDQWKPEDRAALDDQGRPVITFNRCLSIIKAVAGIEINGRHDTVFLPRGTQPGEIKANEILTAASQWMADSCDAEDEQSEAFGDSLICGMGWTEARISYDEEPDGMYVEAKIDPLEMYWDRSARAKNLADARRVFRVRKMTIDEARDFAKSLGAKDIYDDELDASWAIGADTDHAKPVEDRRLREENSSAVANQDEVHIVHAQWIEREPYYRVADELTGRVLTLDADKFAQYEQLAKSNGLRFTHVCQTRKVYKQAFLGSKIIGEVMPCPGKDRFTFQCITGEKHRNKGTWFGLIRLMRDPQQWANKWLSQTLHILNTTAKGGILAERGAFKNIRDAQDTYAQPDAITIVEDGAISGSKIMQKPGAGIPTAYVNLLEFAISSIRDVTGINLELLGMRDANQPGILEAQRKQAAMTILATMFDSLKRYRKNVGRIRLHFIQTFLADDRIIRIIDDEGAMKAIPLMRDQVSGDYEVIIEDAPTSPNQKQETWGFLMQLMPVFKGMMTPEAAVILLEYSPLPSKVVGAFKKMIMDGKEMTPEKQMQMKLGMARAEADLDKVRAGAEKDRANAEATRVAALIELASIGAASQQHLAAGTQNVSTPEPWTGPIIPAENVIEPMGREGPNTLPQVPQLPVQGGQAPREVTAAPAQMQALAQALEAAGRQEPVQINPQ